MGWKPFSVNLFAGRGSDAIFILFMFFLHFPDKKYISYGAFSSDVFTEKLTLLQEFLKKATQQFAVADYKSPDRCVGPL